MSCLRMGTSLFQTTNYANAHHELFAGILYHDMYTRYLVGTQVEMQSLDVSFLLLPLSQSFLYSPCFQQACVFMS